MQFETISPRPQIEGDSMRQEFSAGFHNIEGWTFGTVKIESFAGRRALGSPRWNCRCTVCGSNWQDRHFSITESGQNYRCKNVACGDLHRIRPPKPTAIEHDEKPEPIQFQPRKDSEYERYEAYCKSLGLQAGSQSDWANLDDQGKNEILKPVIAKECADELEKIAREDLRRKYGV